MAMDSSKDSSASSGDSLNLSLSTEERLAVLTQREMRHLRQDEVEDKRLALAERTQLTRWMSETCQYVVTLSRSASKSPYVLLSHSVAVLDSFVRMYGASRLPSNLHSLAAACILVAAKSRKIKLDESALHTELTSAGELDVSRKTARPPRTLKS